MQYPTSLYVPGGSRHFSICIRASGTLYDLLDVCKGTRPAQKLLLGLLGELVVSRIRNLRNIELCSGVMSIDGDI